MKKKVFVFLTGFLIAFLVILATGTRFSRESRYQKTVSRAYESISQIRYGTAHLLCEKAVAMMPEKIEAYMAYAVLKVAQGDYDGAEEELLEGLKTALRRRAEKNEVPEKTAELVYALAGYYYDWNRTEDAIDLLRTLPEEFVNEDAQHLLENLVKPESVLEQDYVIVWKDAAFERLVRSALEKPDGDIMASDVWNLHTLEVWGDHIFLDEEEVCAYEREGYYWNGTLYEESGSIQSLEDLKHFPNLESLCISYQKQLSLEKLPYEVLQRLRKLSLVSDGLEDISPLMWINGLTTLTLDYNNISNFLWVCRMQELNSLSAKENVGFISTDYMENMGRLHSLDLSGTDGVDLERVAEMPELKQLVLGYAQDLSALSENTSIEKLTVITGADGVRGIAQMKALTEIKLTLMQTADLSDLSILGYLEKLELSNESGTEVSLSVVSEITNLSKLALGTGSFTDYSAIARNPAITSVYVPYGDDEKYKCVGKYFPMDWILRYAVS